MKILILVRHAKSSWENAGLVDRDRPLNNRGLRDAPIMAGRLANRLAAEKWTIPVLLSSPAVRAMTMAEAIQAACNDVSPCVLELRDALYTFSGAQLQQVLMDLPADNQHCIVVGHNPALTDTANWLLKASAFESVVIENIPTAGVVILQCEVSEWSDLAAGCAKLLNFDYPKRKSD